MNINILHRPTALKNLLAGRRLPMHVLEFYIEFVLKKSFSNFYRLYFSKFLAHINSSYRRLSGLNIFSPFDDSFCLGNFSDV